MKTKTVYICEKCGDTFLKQEDAKRCEDKHANVLHIVQQIYSGDINIYPNRLVVKMQDGSEQYYERFTGYRF